MGEQVLFESSTLKVQYPLLCKIVGPQRVHELRNRDERFSLGLKISKSPLRAAWLKLHYPDDRDRIRKWME